MVETAKTFRRIAEAIERKLWPVLEPDWANIPGGDSMSNMPLGVIGS